MTTTLGLYQRQLPVQVFTAGHDLVRQWVAVARRPALDDVRNEYLLPAHIDAGKQLFQVMAGRADKRPALLIFVKARTLANEHDARVGRTFTRHRVGPAPAERALGAYFHLGRDFLQGIIRGISHDSLSQNTSRDAVKHPHEPMPAWTACLVPPELELS